MTTSRVIVIVQARLGSVRLPGKVLAPVLGEPVLGLLLRRAARSSSVSDVVLAIPDTDRDAELALFGESLGVTAHRGSEHDVLERFASAAIAEHADLIVRVTGDCPMVDPQVIDDAVALQIQSGAPYVATDHSFPDGFDVEVCTIDALLDANRNATERSDREHVLPYVRRVAGETARFLSLEPTAEVRVTLDNPEDLEVIRNVFEHFGGAEFSVHDVISLASDAPGLFKANKSLSRNWGATVTSGEKLWERAKRVIPGGSMLLSKKAEMFLPKGWPAYFSRASGCRVWDLDDNEYIDVGLMGIGTNILGYGDPRVDEAVRKVIDSGNMSTLNCPEEVELAERLIDLHRWADMARFTRSGGEACAVAVRIARAASGRDTVAFCGYHGWHDWYLSANLGETSALDGHLLPGLAPAGVPRGLQGTALPFAYNDLESLTQIMTDHSVGVIFMEVQRGTEPNPGFLEGVRELATRHNAVLVFDECTSGFRRTLGGLHLHYGVEPDMAVFGKTLGNGYAINAVIGRRAVMEAAHDTFISSTFWTERIGPTAAIASLKAMAEDDAPARIHQIGLDIMRRRANAAEASGLRIESTGLPALGGFVVPNLDPLAQKTFLTQEMLSRGFLAGSAVYASLAHTESVLESFFAALSPLFRRLSDVSSNDELVNLLTNGPSMSGFRRLA